MLQRLASVALLGIAAVGISPPLPDRLPAGAERAIEGVSAAELRGYVETLAGDDFSGRGLGHAGNRKAEQYIAGMLRSAGVQPASGDYLQPIEVYEPALGRDGHLTVGEPGRAPLAELDVGPAFFPLPLSSDVDVSGPLVFAGHGISARAYRQDDYAGLEVTGAVVLVLDDAPEGLKHWPGMPVDELSDLVSLDHKVSAARERGAAGLVVIRQTMGDVRTVWPEHPSVRSATYGLYAPMRASPLAVAGISEEAAKPLRKALDDRKRLIAALKPGILAKPVVMDNVLGMIEGRQGAGAGMVVVGAHLDHDGIDEAGLIYNGADDNASGTAAVLAIAAAFARAAAAGEHPMRAVVFALWNGEEKGSLGAEHYAASPAPARRVIANINLDMIGRREEIPDPRDPRFRGFPKTAASASRNVVHLLGYSYTPDLARTVQRANGTIHLTIKEDYDRDAQGLLRRSDNWPFLRRGVPAVFLTTGLHPDYHTPSDDTERLDFSKLERIAELAGRVTWMTADGDEPRMKSK